ncbi:tyrosine-type recombinase/integrase [Aquirufa ecclesiirivi]
MKLFNDLSLQFNLRKEQGESQKSQTIYCRITCKKVRKNLSTGLLAPINTWCKVTERIKSKEPASIEINEKLALIKQKVINCYFEAKNSRNELSITQIQNEIFPNSHVLKQSIVIVSDKEIHHITSKYLIDLKDKYNAEIISEGTYKSYKSAIVKFIEFVNLYYGTEKTYITSIDKLFFFNFENHLLIKLKLGNNYTHKVLSNTRKLFNFAYDLGILEAKCSIKFKVKYTNPHRSILNISELKTLINLKLAKPHLEEVKDCFVFQCYTGLAFSEIKALRKVNIKNVEGEKWITINRKKTGNESKLILLPIAEAILTKYVNHPYCTKTSQLIPVKSNAKYNNALKQVQNAANLDTNLSSHIGRHIFASTVALQFGLPMETLAKVLGHTNLKTTMIYGKILDNKIKNDFAVLRNNLE